MSVRAGRFCGQGMRGGSNLGGLVLFRLLIILMSFVI